MRNRILWAFFALIPFLAVAQEGLNPKDISYIDVVGEGELELVPDQIYISFTLKERFDGKKKIEIEEQEKELKKRLLKLDIDLSNLQLADANSDYIKIKRKKNDVIAYKDYNLKVSNTTTLAQVFDVLDELDAFNATIQRVDHSEIKKYRKEVKMMAMVDAKEKATYLLSAIGENPGKPISIQERENYNEYQPVMRKSALMSMVQMDAETAEEALPELTFQKIKLKYSVSARFAIR